MKQKEAGFMVVFAAIIAGVLLLVSLPLSPLGPTSSSATVSSVSTAGACPPNEVCGSFSYEPRGQMQVEAVYATESPCGNDCTSVTFAVTVADAGKSPLYIETSSPGIATSLSTNSTALQKVLNGDSCLATVGIEKVAAGGNLTMVGPESYCTGYYYQLVGTGTADMSFNFSWGYNSGPYIHNSTTISAQFDFG